MTFSWIDRHADTLGGWTVRRLRFVADITDMVGKTLLSLFTSPSVRNCAIRSVLLKQIYFTGLEACKIIVFFALILGIVIVSQVVSVVGAGNGSLIGKMLVWVVFRELGPLLTAMVVIARSGTAIAAELGSMKINGEIDSLELLGIEPERYLILPRVVGVASAVVVLTAYFVLTAFVGGFFVASLVHHIPYSQFTQGIVASLGLWDAGQLALKAVSFGVAIPLICCRAGLSVGSSATEIPQAATKAVITSLFAVFMLDGLITFIGSILAKTLVN